MKSSRVHRLLVFALIIIAVSILLYVSQQYQGSEHSANVPQNTTDIVQENENLGQKEQSSAQESEKGLFSSYLVLAVPIFLFFIGLELFIARGRNKKYYRLNDSICDLSCGVTDVILTALVKTIFFGLYTFIYETGKENNYLLLNLPNNVWSLVAAFIITDFIYYWVHRFSHTTAIGWAGHSVHHQSEEFNFTVSIRNGTLQSLFNFWFYLPMAFLGFHPVIYATAKSLEIIYQFWLHTQVIDKMGPLESVINTPSHHRVHHGRNAQYIDKNYAGVFIVWDHIFGTFEPEKEKVVYGLTEPANSWNPLLVNFQVFWNTTKLCYQAPYWIDKLKIWVMPPSWVPRGIKLAEKKTTPMSYKYDPKVSWKLSIYAAVQFVTTVVATVVFLAHQKGWSNEKYFVGIYLLFSLVSVAAIFDKRLWIARTELIRHYIGVGILIYLLHQHSDFVLIVSAAFVLATIMAFWFMYCQSPQTNRTSQSIP